MLHPTSLSDGCDLKLLPQPKCRGAGETACSDLSMRHMVVSKFEMTGHTIPQDSFILTFETLWLIRLCFCCWQTKETKSPHYIMAGHSSPALQSLVHIATQMQCILRWDVQIATNEARSTSKSFVWGHGAIYIIATCGMSTHGSSLASQYWRKEQQTDASSECLLDVQCCQQKPDAQSL